MRKKMRKKMQVATPLGASCTNARDVTHFLLRMLRPTELYMSKRDVHGVIIKTET